MHCKGDVRIGTGCFNCDKCREQVNNQLIRLYNNEGLDMNLLKECLKHILKGMK